MRSLALRTRLLTLACLTGLATTLALPAAAAAATLPITFGIDLRTPGDCIAVVTAANNPTNITLRNAAGELKAQGTVAADDVFFCLDASTWVDSGDRIKANDGTYIRTYRVPELSVEVDRVNNLYLGTGPADRTLLLEYPGSLFGDSSESADVHVGPDGTWSFDPEHDLVWTMDGVVTWESPKGDRVTAFGIVPFINLALGKPGFSGWTTSLGSVEASIQDGHFGSASTVADIQGAFAGKFRNTNGRRVRVAPGDRFMAPALGSDADWIVPNINATTNTATDVVKGVCQQTGEMSNVGRVEVARAGSSRGRARISLDASGHFSVDMGGQATPGFTPVNIQSGDTVVVRCMITSGDWVERSFRAP